jgi:predicted dehydrogenase
MARTIRWGMIGCGEVAQQKSGPGFLRARDSTMIAVADRNGDRAKAFAAKHGVPRWHADAEDVIAAPDVDAVYVATRTDSHCDYVLRCAAAGKPVLVEKPAAMSHAQCQRMIDACTTAGVPLWVAYYRRALPRFLKLRELVESGAVGKVRMATMRHHHSVPSPEAMRGPFWSWRLDPAQSGGGIFFEAVGHTLDILDFVLGPIAEVRAIASNQAGAYPAEDVVAASFRFAGGVLGSGSWCFTADRDDEYNEIVGSEGRIRYSTFPPLSPPPGRPPDPIRVHRGDAIEEFPVADPPFVHEPLIQTIVDEMNGRGRCPSDGASAARTSWVIDEALREFRAQFGSK